MSKNLWSIGVIGSIFMVGWICCLPQPVQAFNNPTWGTTEVPLIMRAVDPKGIRVDMPGSSISHLIACGPRWIFTSAFQVYAMENGKVENLTSYYKPFSDDSRGYPTIACDGRGVAYWTYSDRSAHHVYSYDGTTVANISLPIPNWTSLSEQTVDGQIVFNFSGGSSLWLYNGSAVTTVDVVSSDSELSPGDFSLVLANEHLYKIVGNKALDISTQTGMKWIKAVKQIGGVWYVGGQPGPDDYEAAFPRSLTTYDGSAFTDLSDLVRSLVVSDISGAPGEIMISAGNPGVCNPNSNKGGLFRFDGQQAQKLTVMKIGESTPKAGAMDWNGSYWLTGNFLGSKEDNTGFFRFSNTQDPKALSVFTTKKIGLTFNYPSVWDRPYNFFSKPYNYFGFMLPAYKNVTYNLDFQRGTDGYYNTAIMKRALAKGWDEYVDAFLAYWKKELAASAKNPTATVVSSSRTVSSFRVSGYYATKVVYSGRYYDHMDPKHPNQKYTGRSEYLLVGTKDHKKAYVFNLTQNQQGWTLSPSFYAKNLEAMVKTIRVLK